MATEFNLQLIYTLQFVVSVFSCFGERFKFYFGKRRPETRLSCGCTWLKSQAAPATRKFQVVAKSEHFQVTPFVSSPRVKSCHQMLFHSFACQFVGKTFSTRESSLATPVGLLPTNALLSDDEMKLLLIHSRVLWEEGLPFPVASYNISSVTRH